MLPLLHFTSSGVTLFFLDYFCVCLEIILDTHPRQFCLWVPFVASGLRAMMLVRNVEERLKDEAVAENLPGADLAFQWADNQVR